MKTNVPVEHDPETVVNVHAPNPSGLAKLSKSKMAGPPPIVRFAVLNEVIGKLVPISLIVPLVPNIGSVPDSAIPVTAPAQTLDPEKLMQGALLVRASTPPVMLLALRRPPPPSGIGVADRLVVPTLSAIKVNAPNVSP